MKSTLVVLVALSGWTATALPIHCYNSHDQAADVSAAAATPFHTSYDHAGPFPVRTASSSSADTPHFLDWLAKVPPAQRDTLFHAAEAHRGNWIDRARKMANTWSTFYGTEYPTRPKPPPPQSFDSGNDNSLRDDAFITLGDDTCGFIVENSSDGGGDDTRTTTMLTIPCPSTTLPSHSRPRRPSYFEQLRRHLATMDIAMLCNRYGPELVALCIFLLVPISIVLVEIIDLVHDRMVTEKFPERGRGRVRLTGPERRLSVLVKCERERIVRDQALKSWVNSRRGSRHAAD